MSALRHVTIAGLLLAAGLPSTASLGSVVVSHGVSKLRVVPSSDDVPLGDYSWGSVPSELAGKFESAEMKVTYGLNSATAHFHFLGTANKEGEHFHSEFYELRDDSYTNRIFRYGIRRCYYFTCDVLKKLRRILSFESGTRSHRAILCAKNTSTRSHPQLTLYLEADREVNKRNDQLNMPVDLIFKANQKTTGASAPPRGPHESDDGPMPVDLIFKANQKTTGASAPPRGPHESDDGPPTKSVETSADRCKSMKDGNYLSLFALLNLETAQDGRQRAMLTSHDRNERFSTLSNVLVTPADDFSTTGCCQLGNTRIFICPTGDDDDHLLLRVPGVELELVYADVDAL
ncbi:hypothetical protein FOL46_006116 [Perkinsus olseni]|uniref:Uncharacterized protein n=1 Tax=Perkinsus olseni TaxID=32597 RepID=A0A7J6LME5_PEROL|nr:hypothetical protein FOL46_006116 [Perkinsus olseni]